LKTARNQGPGDLRICVAQRGDGSVSLLDELKAHVAKKIGPIARLDEILFAAKLPKTRSGKIMRRLLKARELGLPEGDISTLESEER
jgi:acetyl-CoA synthetase